MVLILQAKELRGALSDRRNRQKRFDLFLPILAIVTG